ncbi:MAG: T9SS type A sorting domain-containing protein [Bacteroidetes bacterium]|nr:T9SS type A sorting domain-containing protein [Bacteroidota bacterium]
MIHHAHTRRAMRFGCIALSIMALILLAAPPATAQRWQKTFGGANVNGERGNSVTETANGQLVSVGISQSANPAGEVLVIRTTGQGVPVFRKVYQISGASACMANDVKELPNGDLVIVGWVQLTFAKAFVMSITSTGAVNWCRLFSGPYQNTVAEAVKVAQFGPNSMTHAGDILIAGESYQPAPGDSDGVIARFDATGNAIWIRSYNVLFQNQTCRDALFGLDETSAVNPGEIVAVGQSTRPQAVNGSDVWVLRVDGGTGAIGAAPQGSAVFGTAQNDAARGITELRMGAHPGDIAVAGLTYGRPAPSTSSEIVVMQIRPDPCDPLGPRAVRYLGDNGPGEDAGTSLAEVRNAAIGTVGDVVVAGYATYGAFGGLDGFMQEFQEGTLAGVGGFFNYGDVGTDQFRTLTPVLNAPNLPGYAAVGATNSAMLMPPGNTRNLWLVKNNGALNNICHYNLQDPLDVAANWNEECRTTTVTTDPTPVSSAPVVANVTWDFQVCYANPKVALPQGAEAGTAGVAELDAYPRPVPAGDRLTLGYSLTADAEASVAIVDINGKTMYRNNGSRSEGRTTELVPTAGWPAGTYLARVTVNGHSATTRIVVLNR